MEKNQRNGNAVSSMTAVNFSEMKISSNPVETLVAFSIGSGIGMTIHDPVGGVGGVLNFILPDSTKANGTNPAKTPCMFADTGITAFLAALFEQGSRAENLKVVIAGGAHIMDQTGVFNIGQKNLEALKTRLDDYDVKIHHEAIGGTKSRTISLEIGSGRSIIKTTGEEEEKSMTNLNGIVEQINLLAPIPAIAFQIMTKAEDPDSSLSEIADLIVNDPALTANLLKICNSAYFALPRKVESVHDAVAWLGLDQIVELILTNSVSDNFNQGLEGYGLGEGGLWRHAVTSAHVAKSLAHRYGVSQNKHLIYTAALLKDIGKLILGRFVAFSFEKINILVHSQGYSFNDAEKNVIGMNHEELGALVGAKWSFSEKLIYIIRHHHLTDESARQDLETTLVYLADIICMMMGICTGTDGLSYRFYSGVLKRINVSEKDLQGIIAETSENQQKIEHLLKLF